jgi:hypothetical protein
VGGGQLVRTQKSGRTRTCTLNPVTLRSAERWITERRTFTERRLDRLGEYLAESAGPEGSGTASQQAPGSRPETSEESP